jgi:hypothetical protein
MDTRTVEELDREIDDALREAWRKGWRPVELVRALAKRGDQSHRSVVVSAIRRHAAACPDAARLPSWRAELEALGIDPDTAAFDNIEEPARCEVAQRGDPRFLVRVVLPLLRPIAILDDVPGEPTSARPPRRKAPTADAAMLARVRALVAKAESTEFEAEADAFMTKAQELMTRHSIDRALLASVHVESVGDGAALRRIGIDDPYAGAKYTLLSQIASANSCKAVWAQGYGFTTVVGDEIDLGLVELLFTSLVVQANSALAREGRRDPSRRSRPFRQSFLVAFGYRIGERLAAASKTVTDKAVAEHEDLLPVLARRSEAVEAVFKREFPKLRNYSASATDGDGWRAGEAAADLADLRAGAEVGGAGRQLSA